MRWVPWEEFWIVTNTTANAFERNGEGLELLQICFKFFLHLQTRHTRKARRGRITGEELAALRFGRFARRPIHT
jgi:hypothetical protein